MSETYEAEDLTTHQWIALKVLSLRQMMDWKMLDLFEREAEILAQLDHPNIPNYIDSFHLDLDDSSGQSDTNAVQNNPQGEACVLKEHTQRRYTVHYIGQHLMPSEQE